MAELIKKWHKIAKSNGSMRGAIHSKNPLDIRDKESRGWGRGQWAVGEGESSTENRHFTGTFFHSFIPIFRIPTIYFFYIHFVIRIYSVLLCVLCFLTLICGVRSMRRRRRRLVLWHRPCDVPTHSLSFRIFPNFLFFILHFQLNYMEGEELRFQKFLGNRNFSLI